MVCLVLQFKWTQITKFGCTVFLQGITDSYDRRANVCTVPETRGIIPKLLFSQLCDAPQEGARDFF